jgi:hypothetical protein
MDNLGCGALDLGGGRTQTGCMAHIYLQFDFGTDEEKAQLARHKLEVWKQAFRLDKKLLYKFERSAAEGAGEKTAEEPKATKAEAAKSKGKAKSGSKSETKDEPANKMEAAAGKVKLLVRLGFSGHEKLSEHRWVERIPSEEPFVSALPVTMKTGEAGFEVAEKRFEELE